MAGSDDSLDKSDLDDNTESQDNYKSFRNSSLVLEVGQKIGSDRSAFVRHGTPNFSNNLDNCRTSPTASIVEEQSSTTQQSIGQIFDNTNDGIGDRLVNNKAAQPQKKKNPYSIEELLRKDENKVTNKRPRLIDNGIVQPCGIIVIGNDG